MPWLQVRLAITPDQAAALEDQLLELGAVSVTFMDAEDQPIFEPDLGTTPLWSNTHLLALFEDGTDGDAVLAHLKLLRGGELPESQVERIEDQDWERSWMDNFQPMRFGQRLWIVPSWHEAPEPEAVNLLLDPGLAFGTGTHPTTALCLRWLDALADAGELQGQAVLDVGCGSGILALAALKLGAASAMGVDNDPQALTATADNAARNGVAIAAFLPEQAPQAAYPVVVANILASALDALAETLAARTAPGGRLAMSGILAGQEEALLARFAPWFDALQVAREDDWVRLDGIRNQAAVAA